ncbi:inositol monophosphatase family protein [uncultured Bacteroides sp.]|uniref:inositol monophosphatase family protein n=1 Tax=uncultured Bacteroides sp. TaxID=162156 RepID=UPI0025E0F3CB|nr:inositol monophosphatase family protein [uncultured Bacteroides sp.]
MDICRDIYSIIRSKLNEILELRSTGTLKADNTFVSEGDLLCESLIFSYLKDNLANYIVISEESNNDIFDIDGAEFVVTVDPIDGTENFVSGLKEWGVGISVYRNGKHYQSMIALPELDICLCTGEKLERIKKSRICGLSSYMTPEDFEVLGGGLEYRIMGCCMYNMYNVIHGSYKQFQHLKGCFSWDILPGINLALEHGLSVIIDGKAYNGEFLKPGMRYMFEVY